MDARMEAIGEQFPVDFIGGPHDGLFGATKYKVNEVTTQTEKHPACWTWVSHIYRRSNPDSQKFYYVETINDTQGCQRCEDNRKANLEREAAKRDRELFREYAETIKVVIDMDEGGGYDWEDAQIGVGKDGKLWIRYGSGCSCNSIEDEDWEPLKNRQQALDATRHMNAPIKRAKFIAKATELLAGQE